MSEGGSLTLNNYLEPLKPEIIKCTVCVDVDSHNKKTNIQMNHDWYHKKVRGTTRSITATIETLHIEVVSNVTTTICYEY